MGILIKFYPRKRARKPPHFPRTRIPKRCRFHCTARLQPNPREFRRPLWRPTRRVRELFRERRFAFALPMPVRVDSSFFLFNALAPHHDDEDRCDQRRQEISSNIHPTNVSARDFIVLSVVLCCFIIEQRSWLRRVEFRWKPERRIKRAALLV